MDIQTGGSVGFNSLGLLFIEDKLLCLGNVIFCTNLKQWFLLGL
jgi:hypothetical protein